MLTSSRRGAPVGDDDVQVGGSPQPPVIRSSRLGRLWATRRTHPRRWNRLLFGVVLAGFAVLAFQRRWMSDDGLIVLRTVRNVLEGHGPVFNVGERVEANTSTVWTALLTVAGLVPGISLEWASVLLGLVFAVAGLALAMDTARRLHEGQHAGRVLLPAGALLVCALPPFRDFATSGLETGLVSAWLGLVWWLLVRRWQRSPAERERWPWAFAVLVGLGPLIRPDLALATAVALAAVLALRWPGWRRTALLGVAAGAIPLAYEVFRAGYYGLLVPSTAVAKEASDPMWGQGLTYLGDLVWPYQLWIPLLLLAVVLALVLVGRRRGLDSISADGGAHV